MAHDWRHFDRAFNEVTSSIVADDTLKATLRTVLRKFFVDGGYPRDEIREINRILADGSWRWPEFDAQMDALGGLSQAEAFHHRLWNLAYTYGHDDEFKINARHAPYKMFSAVKDSRSPPECLAADGFIKKHDDEFWLKRPIPCARLNCRCKYIQLSERERERIESGRSR